MPENGRKKRNAREQRTHITHFTNPAIEDVFKTCLKEVTFSQKEVILQGLQVPNEVCMNHHQLQDTEYHKILLANNQIKTHSKNTYE